MNRYTVAWRDAAVDELTEIWLAASDRNAGGIKGATKMGGVKMKSREWPSSSMRLIATTVLAIAVVVLNGCGRSNVNATLTKSTSVADLLTTLPNLKPHDIESCSYTVEKGSPATWVPSPSDVRVEVVGSAVLSEDGAKALKSQFDWKPVPRADIPESLSAIVPSGDVLVSQSLNEDFTGNPTYRHGFVAALTNDGWKQIYFLATDLDHPIKSRDKGRDKGGTKGTFWFSEKVECPEWHLNFRNVFRPFVFGSWLLVHGSVCISWGGV